jgi:hypothetical protein
MVVLVCGSRHYKDYQRVYDSLKSLQDVSLVITGGCRGADALASRAAQALGYPVQEFPADWKSFGKAAGPIRNQKMLDIGRPDMVIAFHENWEQSKGTKDMVLRTIQLDIPLEVVS